MNRSLLKFFFVSLVLGGASACSTNNKTDYVKEITDLNGRKVQLKKSNYDRVVCIGAGALRLYSYVGHMNKIIGAEDIDRNVDGANPFKDISRPYFDVHKDLLSKTLSIGIGGPQHQSSAETELILKAKPDIVISEMDNTNGRMDKLQEVLNVPVVVVDYGAERLFDPKLAESLRLIGDIFGDESKAKANSLVEYINSSKKDLEERAKEKVDMKCFVGCLGNWGTRGFLSTSNNYPNFVVNNLENAVEKDLELDKKDLDLDYFVAKARPDIIFVDSAGAASLKSALEENKDRFKDIPAIANNNFYLQMPYNAYMTNVEIALMNAYFISYVTRPNSYPSDFNFEEKCDEIGKKFLGVEGLYSSNEDYSIKNMPKSFGGFRKLDITNL